MSKIIRIFLHGDRIEIACFHTLAASGTGITDFCHISGGRHKRDLSLKGVPHLYPETAAAAAIADHEKTPAHLFFEFRTVDKPLFAGCVENLYGFFLGDFAKF